MTTEGCQAYNNLPEQHLPVPLETKQWAQWTMAWQKWAFLFFWPWWVSQAYLYPSIWCSAVVSNKCLWRRHLTYEARAKRSFPAYSFPASNGERLGFPWVQFSSVPMFLSYLQKIALWAAHLFFLNLLMFWASLVPFKFSVFSWGRTTLFHF